MPECLPWTTVIDDRSSSLPLSCGVNRKCKKYYLFIYTQCHKSHNKMKNTIIIIIVIDIISVELPTIVFE